VTGGVTSSYVYDGASIFRETRGATTVRYVHGPDFDEPLAVDDGTAVSYFHADGLDSIVKVSNAAGAVTHARQYDAWGNLEVEAAESGYAFTGREWDPETGLYYYRARYYDPKSGRFVSQDPIGLMGDDLNLYRYVWGMPTTWTDPFGLKGRKGGKKRTVDSVAEGGLRDAMKNPHNERNEICFSVCEREGDEPFASPWHFSGADNCPVQSCPTGAARVAICHAHPWVGGYPGHSPGAQRGGGDFAVAAGYGVPSYTGQGGNVWKYNYFTDWPDKEKQICCTAKK
jgi:RHS repeat-associated protein